MPIDTKLETPEQGVSYLLENNMLTNEDPNRGEFPAGEPVQYFLFMSKIKSGKITNFIHLIEASDEEKADQELLAIANRDDVIYIDSRRTRQVLAKDWKEERCAKTSS